MMDKPPAILHRRDFLKLAALGLGTLTLFPNSKQPSPELLIGEPLGRVNVGKVEVKNLPDVDSKTTLILYEDAIVRWLREVVGRNPNRTSQRWVETPDGYIWSPYLQPVLNQPNVPFKVLPESSVGPGMWTEVSTPFVDMLLANPPARSPGFQNRLEAGLPVRLYFSQLVWVDGLRADEQGQIWYRINERFGTYGDILWGKAEAFRPVSSEEIEAINPEATEKRVVVNIAYQTLSCYQEDDEVFFARISSGALYDYRGNKVDAWATPTGKIPIWRKLLSLHMSGGTTGGGWDLPAVAYTSLFVGSGVAIHSTFWHNNFGEPMSRGCVNAKPEDARWVFRWTQPFVPLDPGDVTVPWPGGTAVEIIEG